MISKKQFEQLLDNQDRNVLRKTFEERYKKSIVYNKQQNTGNSILNSICKKSLEKEAKMKTIHFRKKRMLLIAAAAALVIAAVMIPLAVMMNKAPEPIVPTSNPTETVESTPKEGDVKFVVIDDPALFSQQHYSTIDELAGASDEIYDGKVTGVSFAMLNAKNGERDLDGSNSDVALHTIYEIEPTKTYKGKAAEKRYLKVIGGIEGQYVEEQKKALEDAGMYDPEKGIVVYAQSEKLAVGESCFFLTSNDSILGCFKHNMENGKLNESGDLVKTIKENDDYNTSYKELSAYSYDLFMLMISQKKPSSCFKIISTSSFGMSDLVSFNDLFPIEKLTVITDDCICAEYKLDKNGNPFHTYVVFERKLGTTEDGENYELWQYYGELYFACPTMTFNDLSAYQGYKGKADDLPFIIDLKHTVFFGKESENTLLHSEETVLLNDGFAIFDYIADSPDGDEIEITDITFIPYGETNENYPDNYLIKYAFTPNEL